MLEALVPYSFPAYAGEPRGYISCFCFASTREPWDLSHFVEIGRDFLRWIAPTCCKDETRVFGSFVRTPLSPRISLGQPGEKLWCGVDLACLPHLTDVGSQQLLRPVHWGRLPGFVLQGSIPQLQAPGEAFVRGKVQFHQRLSCCRNATFQHFESSSFLAFLANHVSLGSHTATRSYTKFLFFPMESFILWHPCGHQQLGHCLVFVRSTRCIQKHHVFIR